MSSDKVKETKEKILNWLKQEGNSPEEIADPNAFFNIAAKVGSMVCNVVQNVQKMDSFFVATNLLLSPDELAFLKKIGAEKRKELFWDLRMSLLKNNELGAFEIKPNPPEEMQTFFISSRPIFYEDLMKGSLMSAIYAVMKATHMVVWMLQQYAGITPPKKDQRISYSA